MYASLNHDVYLSKQNIYELREIIKRKLPSRTMAMEDFLDSLSYTVISSEKDSDIAIIRDPKDQPILDAAIKHKLDVILTGDKDFLSLRLKRPKCMSVAEFCRREKIWARGYGEAVQATWGIKPA